ncbi:TolC family outer membrane protein [Neptunomonas qingdaonensis]|uniref:Outer membrane protein, adhesin transport system n=1 Tax=Neptunomonas qingdaonensis TaxID=1045558 RepID=A0A1I2NQA6_9GAMM|nr:TolC family outer membrane protein [Neptunomonas qingdaonensis]SFG06084.1 outer membrane protein, adhesin transport system [Neptunomonas qingdaonensis]
MILKRTLLVVAVMFSSVQATYASQLEEIVTRSVLSSPEVKRSMDARNAVYEEVRQARGGFYPKIDIAAGVGYEWTKNTTTQNVGDGDVELRRREASISLRQMLFDGFLTDSEVDRHASRLEANNHHLREVAEEKALETTRAYLEVIKRQELLNQANETLYNHVRVYEQIRKRSESGLGTLASIQQATGRLALAEVNVLSAENNLRDAQVTFQRVVGDKAPDTLETPLFNLSSLPESESDSVKRATVNHPTLKLAQADIQAAQSQYDSARSLMYPKLNFEVDRNWNNNIDGVEGDNEDLTAMFRVRYNIYNGGSDKARIRQTRHQINEAKDIKDNALRQTVEGVSLSWNAYEILGRQLAFFEKHVDSSSQTRDSYLKQFNIGQRSLLDLLDTENEVFSSKNALIAAKYDYLLAQYRLVNGMGEMLELLKVDLEPLASTALPEDKIRTGQTTPKY